MAEFGDSQGNVYHDPVEFMLRPFFPEKAGTTEASLKDQGTKPPIAPKNSGMDFFRDMNDENQFPGNPPLSPVLPGINDKGKSDQDPNLKIRRVENTDIRTLFPHMPDDEVKAWEQSPPRELQHKYKGNSNILDIPGTLDSKGHEDGVFVDQLHPDLLKLNQDEYDIRFVPKHEIFHIQRRVKPPLVGEADLPANAQLAQYGPGNKESNPPLSEEDWKDFWNAPGSRNLSVGKASPFPLDQLLDQNPKGFLVERGHLGLHDLDPNKYEILEAPDQTYSKDHLFVRPKKKDAEVGEADIPVNARLTAAEGPTTTLSAMVDSFTNPNSNVPAPTNMAKAGFTAEHYNKVVNFLDNLSDMKGAENWSAKELIGYALSHGMNALGFDGVKVPTGRGHPSNQAFMDTQLTGKTGFGKFTGEEVRPVANENIKMSLREQLDKAGIKSMSADEYKQYQADRKLNPSESDKELAKIQEAAAEWAKDHPPTSSYERALENQKAGKMNPAGDTADEFINSVNKPNLKLVTENPSQEPQAGRKPSPEEIAMQYNQRQEQIARDKANKVNVGPGKGVLNDNADRVEAMQRAGRTTSEIAKAFDITPNAVRSWIKNQPEKVVAADQNPAAVKIGNTWYRGSSHADAMENAAKELGQSHDPYALNITDEGFFTNKGNYISREKAFVLAKRHGQVELNSTSNEVKQLMSEDLLDSTGKSLTDRARETIERLNAAIKAVREKRD